jgi:hypothetical protein
MPGTQVKVVNSYEAACSTQRHKTQSASTLSGVLTNGSGAGHVLPALLPAAFRHRLYATIVNTVHWMND